MPIQAQISPSSMSSTGLSEASVATSEGAGMRFGMPLIYSSRPSLIAWNCSSNRSIRSLRGSFSAFQYWPERLTLYGTR